MRGCVRVGDAQQPTTACASFSLMIKSPMVPRLTTIASGLVSPGYAESLDTMRAHVSTRVPHRAWLY